MSGRMVPQSPCDMLSEPEAASEPTPADREIEALVTEGDNVENKPPADETKVSEETEEEKKQHKEEATQFNELCTIVKDALGDKVEKVIVSNRITDSPCVLVTGQFSWSSNCSKLTEFLCFFSTKLTEERVSLKGKF